MIFFLKISNLISQLGSGHAVGHSMAQRIDPNNSQHPNPFII